MSAALPLTAVAEGAARWRADDRAGWDACLARTADQPVAFSSPWLDYQHAYFAERAARVDDLSLVLVDGDRPVGLWPISRHVADGGAVTIGSFGDPLAEPVFAPDLPDKVQRRLTRAVVDTLAELVADTTGGELLLRATPDGAALSELGRRLSQDHPMVGCAVELVAEVAPTEEARWRTVRSSYRSPMRRLLERARTEVLDRAGDGGVEVLRDLHLRVAGQATRGEATWRLQQEAVDRGAAFVVVVLLDGGVVGASLIHRTDRHAVYAVGAYDRELMADGLHIGHLAQWATLGHLAEHTDVRTYTLGWRSLPGPDRDPKVAAIEQFKEGFATANLVRPLFRLGPDARP